MSRPPRRRPQTGPADGARKTSDGHAEPDRDHEETGLERRDPEQLSEPGQVQGGRKGAEGDGCDPAEQGGLPVLKTSFDAEQERRAEVASDQDRKRRAPRRRLRKARIQKLQMSHHRS